MKDSQLIHRRRVLFAASLSDFLKAKEEFLSELDKLAASGNKAEAVQWAADMFIDAQSFLTAWKLDRWLAKEEKDALIDACRSFIAGNGTAEDLSSAEAEVDDIRQCKLMHR